MLAPTSDSGLEDTRAYTLLSVGYHDIQLVSEYYRDTMSRCLPSAFKHGLSEGDIEYALANPIRYTIKGRGGHGVSVLGLSVQGITIEVIGEYDPLTGDLVVFHAQNASEGKIRRYLGGRR